MIYKYSVPLTPIFFEKYGDCYPNKILTISLPMLNVSYKYIQKFSFIIIYSRREI